jgi:regulator of sigma E protease
MMISIISAIVVLGVLIFVHELGHFLVAKISKVRVVKFSLGFGPKILGKKAGDTEYLISMIPLGGYIKMLGESDEEEIKEEDLKRSFLQQSLWKRAGIVAAGPIFNFLFGALLFSLIYCFGVPTLTTEVGEVRKGFPAEKMGIVKGDIIVAINDREVSKWEELSEIIQKNGGEELKITLKRGSRLFNIQLSPIASPSKNIFGEDIEVYLIGISASERFIKERYNPIIALFKGLEHTWRITELTVMTLVKLVERKISLQTLGGPILIAQLAGKQAQAGILSFLFFMGLLSINLGVLNLLPIPILDGGHLCFFALEGIFRRPLKEKIVEIAQQVGLFILILLMIFVFYNDILRIING